MFSEIVAIEPVSLILSAEKALHTFANEVAMYPDIPADDEEIVRRIDDADAVLLSYTSSIRREDYLCSAYEGTPLHTGCTLFLPYHYKRSGDFCSSVLLCRMRDDAKLLHFRLFQMP